MAPTRGPSSRLLILGAVGALLLAACGPVAPPPVPPPQPAGRVAFESENLPLGQLPTLHDFSTGSVGVPTVISGDLELPSDVTGRVPAVIPLPTCSGVGGPETAWARELAGWGLASFVVDPYSGRGIREVCSGSARINPFRCQFLEQPDGRFVDREGHPASQNHPCLTRGYPRGYAAQAHRRMSEDVRAFLSAVLRAER